MNINPITFILPHGLYKFQWETIKDAANQLSINESSKILIIDVDGCIRDGSHRYHLLPTQEQLDDAMSIWHDPQSAYKAFNDESVYDTRIQPVIRLIQQLTASGEYTPIVLTSCSSNEITTMGLLSQLRKWDVPCELICMRGKGNQNSSVTLKETFLNDLLQCGVKPYNITALDDDKDICNMMRSYDVLALQVEDWTRGD